MPQKNPELANGVRRYSAGTATLCPITTTAARAGLRMDLIQVAYRSGWC
jgi:hypothetical protein